MKKSIHLIILLSAVLVSGCSRNIASLTIMTYNVGVFDKYMDDSTGEIAALVKSLGADVVALNELDSCNRRHDTFQLEDFAQALGGWNHAYSSSFPFADGSYGNGIAATDTFIYEEKVLLPLSDGAEQRSMMVVETEKYVMACTHLDHKGENARMDQVRFINSWINGRYARSDKPVFLCGDMNAVPDDPVVSELLRNWMLLSVTEATWPSQNPEECLDYIFCLKSGKPIRILKSEIPEYHGIEQYSDHLPLLVKVCLWN